MMGKKKEISWFDGFTKYMLLTMFVLLFLIFGSAYYMNHNNMKGTGTDETVNDMASQTAKQEHHPFVELPGDAEVGAFSVANLFAGLIVGYNWRKLSEHDEQAG
jgi:cobalt/nickel transport protein